MTSPPSSEPLYTTADLAAEWRCSDFKVRKAAKALGVGFNLGGRAGYRFTEADRLAMMESLRPGGAKPAAPAKRRKRRAA